MSDLEIIPRLDAIVSEAQWMAQRGRCDAQLAPIWAEKLRHSFGAAVEVKYPEYMAANGDILPIDTSVDPAALEWEYFMVDSVGVADWIDDSGRIAPNSAISMSRHVGAMKEMGHSYDWNIFDLERSASAKLPLSDIKSKAARRAHDAKTNWTWLFGDSKLGMPGLASHPNISVSLAALNAGNSSRLWSQKTADEIATDMGVLINTIANNTLGAYHASTVLVPRNLFQRLRDLRLGAGDGFASVLDWMENRFKGDASGAGKVSFKIMNECQGTLRRDPLTGTDTSGISGDFLLAYPSADKSELSFIRARPFTQRPPQEQDFVVKNLSHSKIGGCKCQIPLAVHRLDFGLT